MCCSVKFFHDRSLKVFISTYLYIELIVNLKIKKYIFLKRVLHTEFIYYSVILYLFHELYCLINSEINFRRLAWSAVLAGCVLV